MSACVNPYVNPEGYKFPCGSCTFCRKNRVRQWMFRLLQEDKVSENSLFVTLTYENGTVPRTAKKFKTLLKSDVQKWMKRLRKANPGKKIRYYLVGEYGPKTQRPHYHAILFNCDPNTISDTWKLGEVDIGDVSGASVSYVAGYISKPGKKIGYADWDDRVPKFSLMSKGLGSNYLTPEMEKFYLNDLTRNYVMQDGYKIGLPRYYRKKISYTDEEREEIQEFAALAVQERELKEYENILDKYPEKSFSEYKREKIEYFRENEKFLNRKL